MIRIIHLSSKIGVQNIKIDKLVQTLFWLHFLVSIDISEIKADTSKRFANRLYLDFAGRRPSLAESDSLERKLSTVTTEAQARELVRRLLLNDLMATSNFERRLTNYFNGLMDISTTDGNILPVCQDPGCIDKETAKDFSEEAPRYIARVISGNNNSFLPDIREILISTKTIFSTRIAQAFINNPELQVKLGSPHLDLDELETIASQSDPTQWMSIDRDPNRVGIPTGTANFNEIPSGILTTPSYLLKNTTHLSRAINFYAWFLCSQLEQAKVPETQGIKLIKKAPCSGCHSVIEPLGSFWVHWRARIDNEIREQHWILDGQSRTHSDGSESLLSGIVPIDINDPLSPHSRDSKGSILGKYGLGAQGLGAIAATDDRFPRCMAQHAWQFVMGRAIFPDEMGWPQIFGQKLVEEYDWDLREVIADMVLAKPYSGRSFNE